MTVSRRWPSSIVLLCLGLMPADDVRCFAADPPAAQTLEPPAAQALPAAAPQEVAPDRDQPATARGSLLGAILGALGVDLDDNNRRERAVEDQNIRNLEAEFRPQFQQLLYVELAFLRRVCKPDAKPFAEIAKTAKSQLHVPLHEYVVKVNRARSQQPGGSNAADPRAEIRKLLTPVVEANFGAEKARFYRQECDKRAEARKHAVVLNIVAALDERLVLTAQQRAKLVESLSAHYQRMWDPFLDDLAENYLPSIRDELIVPVLDERQKSVWEQVPKAESGDFDGGMAEGPLSDDATEIQEIARIAGEVQDDR
jgi:hypothetical protein